jgi:hypothetical protein
MISASPLMKHSITSARILSQDQSTMNLSTFNFHCDTLYDLLADHPHRQEIIEIMDAQVKDDTLLY